MDDIMFLLLQAANRMWNIRSLSSSCRSDYLECPWKSFIFC